MSDRVETPPPASEADDGQNRAGDGNGWFAPEGALTEAALAIRRQEAAAAAVPLPTDAEPERPGGWYVPPEATGRVSALILAEARQRAEVQRPELPQRAGLSTEADYSSYVPGVGFVSPEEAEALQRAGEVGATPTAPDEEESPTETAPASAVVPDTGAQPALHFPEPHHAGGQAPEAPPAPRSDQAVVAPAEAAAEPAAEAEQPADLSKRFLEVELAVQVLRRKYKAGNLTRDQLKDELRRLMILDDNGQWWMIGLETDRWYKYDGKEWVLETPPGYVPRPEAAQPADSGGSAALKRPATASETGFPQNRFDIPLDEYGMPLPQKVPVEDPGATMVGRWVSRLESEAQYADGAAPYDSGVTVPSRAVDPNVTQRSSAAGWQARLAQQQASGVAVDASPGALTQKVEAPARQVPESVQPDYGLQPKGLVADRQRYGGCLIRLAILSVFVVLGGSFLVTVLAVAGYTSIIARYDEGIRNLGAAVDAESQSVRFYDVNNNLLGQLNDPNLGARLQVTLQDISPYMIHATISTENERFYSDPGFDLIAITRAVLQNLRAGGIASGASTLTQQLARAKVLEPGAANDRSSGRKINEVIVSSEIARRYTKNQILEFYLNTIYYGNLAYGVEAAAQTYFKKSARDLNLAEASFLAGLAQAPALYDPAINPTGAINRAKTVRQLMVKVGCLQMEHEPYVSSGPFCVTEDEINKAVVQIAQVEAQMATFRPTRAEMKYPHFLQYVRQQLEAQFGQDALYTSGFNVYTTIDPRIQDAAQQAVQSQIAALRGQNASTGAVLALRPSDGAILAMVGSADFYNDQIDGQVNITLAARQPGSAIKPFVYVAALERDAQNQYWTPATIIWDVESCFGTQPLYCPVNYDRRFHGPQSMRSSLANSYNVPAVKAMAYVGIERFKDVADRVGLKFPLTQPEQAGLATALGATEVRLIDLVSAYAVLANNGARVEPYAIKQITRKKGDQTEIVYTVPEQVEQRQVVEPGLAFLITSILADNAARTPAFGANNPLVLRNGHLAAAKTGTTNDNKDAWTVGYTPNLVVGTWVGNADGSPMRGIAGSLGAAPIWNQVMTAALSGVAPVDFRTPPTLQQLTICADFGSQDFAECQNRRAELFLASNPPPAADSIFRVVPVDTFTGLVANDNCPEYVETRAFLTVDDPTAFAWLNNTQEGQEWATRRGLKLPLSPPPTGSCQPGMLRPVVRISNPQPGAQVSGLLQIIGAVDLPGFNRYQIEVGAGHDPQAFGIVDGPIASMPGSNDTFIGRWDTGGVPEGPYTIKLWAVDGEGRFVEVKVPVQVVRAAAPTPAPFPTPVPFPTPEGGVPGIPPTATPPGFPTAPPDGGVPGFQPTETPIVIESTLPEQPTPPVQIFPPTTSP